MSSPLRQTNRDLDAGSRVASHSTRTQVRAARLRSWFENKRPVFLFGFKFALMMAFYYALVLTPFCEHLLYSYLSGSAWLANGLLHLLGQDTSVAAITIRSARFAITVRRGCDAIEPAWYFCAAVCAFPAPWRFKLLACLAGTVILQLLNLLRIVSLYLIGIHYPRFFPTAHLEIWPVLFVLSALVLWAGWISRLRRNPDAVA